MRREIRLRDSFSEANCEKFITTIKKLVDGDKVSSWKE